MYCIIKGHRSLTYLCEPLLNVTLWDNSLSRDQGNLAHWGRVTHICVGKLIIIGSDNDLSSGQRQSIIWTNAGILLIGPLGTNLSEILIGIQVFSFKKMHLKMASVKWRPFCFGLYESRQQFMFIMLVTWYEQTFSITWPLVWRNPQVIGSFPSQMANNSAIRCPLSYWLKKLLNQQLCCQWIEIPWHLCYITAMVSYEFDESIFYFCNKVFRWLTLHEYHMQGIKINSIDFMYQCCMRLDSFRVTLDSLKGRHIVCH